MTVHTDRREHPAPKRQRRRRIALWARVCVVLGALLMVAGGAGLIGTRVFASIAFHSVKQETLLGGAGNQAAQRGHVEIQGAKTILMIGTDARPNQSTKDLVRSDSIIVAHIPASHDAVYMISIPRDTSVRIPAYDNGAFRYPGGQDRINAAFAYGGKLLTGAAARKHAIELLAMTIKKEYGVTFDAAAIVDFDGFRAVVKALGGVDMFVDQETTSIHIGYTKSGEVKVPFRLRDRADGGTDVVPVPGVEPQRYHVGQQHLSPHLALDYVRQRELLPKGDYDRQRHQQQFVKAVARQIASRDTLTDPVKLAQVIDSVGKAMTIDSGGIPLEDWVYAMRGMTGESIVTLKTNNGSYHSTGSGAESLDETTVALLAAVRDDTVGAFTAAHPELITQS